MLIILRANTYSLFFVNRCKTYTQNQNSTDTLKVQIRKGQSLLVLWVRAWHLSHFRVSHSRRGTVKSVYSHWLRQHCLQAHIFQSQKGKMSEPRWGTASIPYILITPICPFWKTGTFIISPFESQVDFVSLDSKSKFVLFLPTVLM